METLHRGLMLIVVFLGPAVLCYWGREHRWTFQTGFALGGAWVLFVLFVTGALSLLLRAR